MSFLTDKDAARFDAKVSSATESGCLIWTAHKDKKMGYGMFWLRGTMRLSHRVAYERHNGEIPDGLHVCHSCDTPCCVNPAHLWLGTNLENVADKVRKGRQAGLAGELHPSAKLNIHDVQAIRSSDLSHRNLARIYGVDRSTIGYIRNGKLWASIGERI